MVAFEESCYPEVESQGTLMFVYGVGCSRRGLGDRVPDVHLDPWRGSPWL